MIIAWLQVMHKASARQLLSIEFGLVTTLLSVFLAGVSSAMDGGELAHSNQRGRDFRGVDLTNADLTMADFSGADLRGAKLAGAKLDRINLDDADLRGVIGWAEADLGFGLSANRANFSQTDLRGARVVGGSSGGYFEGADFRGSNLTDATLHGRFHGAKFDGAIVNGTLMVGALGIEPDQADLQRRGAIVNGSDFSAAVKAGRDFSGYQLSVAPLQGVDLTGAQLRGANMHSANISGTKLVGANLQKAELYFCDAQGARFEGADLSQAPLNYIRAADANFDGAKLRGATLYGADLTGTSFQNADLTNADLSFADLSGADLTGAVLNGIKVDAAIIDGVRGLDPATIRQLRGKAGRWRHDLFKGFEWFVSNLSLPLHLVLTLFLGTLGLIGLYHARRGVRASFGVLAAINGLAVIPFLFALAFAALGGSHVAQMSDPHLWSAWFRLHGMLAMAMLVLLLASLICAGFHLVRHVFTGRQDRKVLSCIVALLTPVNCLLAFGAMALTAPDA